MSFREEFETEFKIAILVAALTAFAPLQPVGAQGALLLGDVVAKENGTPLAHSMVTMVGAERQTFTSDGGVFAFKEVEPGKYRIRAVHIGYSPVEVSVEVPAGTAPPRIRIELAHLSVQLAAVKVVAARKCTTPGRPNPDVEPEFAAIVAQVRMNAEQYRVLSDSFPFRFRMQHEFFSMRADSSRTDASFEVDTLRSDGRGWEYRVGDVIGPGRRGQTVMHLPALSDFAGYEFLNNHCFTYGGVEASQDGNLIRIDFMADVQLRAPDVNGSIFLDAKSYQIRRAELQLTKIPPSWADASAVKVTTIFGEVAPSVDVITRIRGLFTIRHRAWGGPVATGEDQWMSGLEWLKSNPAHPSPN